jgi:hypothetical protein
MIHQETVMKPEALDSYDVHNELSPILDTIEVLLEMCCEIELGISPAAARVDALVAVIIEKAADLRTALDTMCDVKRRD